MLMQQIKYFTAVVNCQSFTEAAEQCYITQSAISQQIKSLEKELGVQLIQRGKRKFALTAEGEFFYRNCVLLVEEFNRLKSETKQISRLKANRLRVGALNSYGGAELLNAAAALTAKYPELSLDLVAGTHEELYEMIAGDEIDAAFNDLRRAVTNEYAYRPLITSRCYVAVALPRVASETLRSFPCIVIAAADQLNAEKRFLRLALGLSDNFIRAASLEEAMFMVIGNKGYLPMDMYSLNCARYKAFIRCLPFYRQDEQLSKQYGIFWKRSRQNDGIEEFARLLSEKFSSTQTNEFD